MGSRTWYARAGAARLGAFVSAAACAVLISPAASAQSAQQRVYGTVSTTTTTSVLPAYNKDSTTGALTLLPTAPFADRLEGGLLAIDGQGKFLFALNAVSNNISMFQIDSSTGALTEVPNSPFAAGPTVNPGIAPSAPISLATEKSGNFLYVGYANSNSNSTSALMPFTIDTANLRLNLTAQQSLDFGNGAPVQMQADSKGLHLYVGLGPGGNQTNVSSGTIVFSIDSSIGVLTKTGMAGGGSDWGRSIAVDPQGRFFFDGWGQSQGFLDSGAISPVDGTSSVSSTLNLGQGVFPSVLLVDASGKFLYVQTGAGLLIYSIDGTSGELTLLNGPLTEFGFAAGRVAADPMGPFLYSLGKSGVDVFQIDAQSGSLTEISGAPFATGASTSGGSLGLAISGSAIQSVSGPAAQVFPSPVDFGQITVGSTSSTKIVSVVNVGDQTLAIGGISLTGANATDFSQSNTCGATLAPNANCSVSILYSPSLAGGEHALLQVSTNAPGSPQTAALTGTGVAAKGAVTLAPGNVDFGLLAQGASATRNVQVTNSGSAALHISNISLGGSNPGDFSQTSNCTSAAIAIQASCTIAVTLAPQAQGQRTASLVIADDGSGSPHSVALSGSGAAPFQITAPGTSSASVTAGQTAQYALQAAAGPGFSGNVSLTCSGAPLAATCSVTPNNIAISGSAATPLQVTVTTTGNAFALPRSIGRPHFLIRPIPAAALLAACILLLWSTQTQRPRGIVPTRIAWVAMLLATGLLGGVGCGGAGANSAPPQTRTVTPHGTTMLTVTAQSGTLPAQTVQLMLTVN